MKDSEICTQLDAKYFIHTHKSYIVNLCKVIGPEAEGILMENGDIIPVSRLYKKEFFLFNVIFTLIIISLCHMFGNRQIRLQSLSHEIIYTLIAFSAILTLMCVGTFWVVETVATKEIYYYSMGIITGALILFYMGLYMIKTITHFVDHEHKCNRKIAQIEQNMRHYDELNTIYCKMKKIKHDLKNSMCTLIHIMEDVVLV